MRKPAIAVVGLGNMGLGMARTLTGVGWPVVGVDPSTARRALLANALPDAAAACGRARTLLLSLPGSREVEAVVRGEILPHAQPETLVIDASTADPASTRTLAAELAEAGHALVDAPVSGGPSGAASGQLLVMAGGDAAALKRARPVLEALARKVVVCGGPGAGHAVKLANNLLVAIHLVAASEALKLADAVGVEARTLLAALSAGSGRSAVIEMNLPRWVLSGAFDSGFSAGLMRKDLELALAAARSLDAPLALGEAAAALWRGAGLAPDDDFNRIVPSVRGR